MLLVRIIILTCLLHFHVTAQTYEDIVDVDNLHLITPDTLSTTMMDSGWRKLFPGDTGFINHNNRFTVTEPGVFSTGGAGGYMGTNRDYSRYELRAQIRHDNSNTGNNAGIMYHANLEERVWWGNDNLVLSLEYQGRVGDLAMLYMVQGDYRDQNNGLFAKSTGIPGDLYPLDFVWDVPTENYQAYYDIDPQFDTAAGVVEGWVGGPAGDAGPGKHMGPLYGGRDRNQAYYVTDQWNLMTLKVYGADSAIHLANNVLALKIWDMRLSDTDPDGPAARPLQSGRILFQSEGSALSYRNIWIKELDEDLCPVHQAWPCCQPHEQLVENECVDTTNISLKQITSQDKAVKIQRKSHGLQISSATVFSLKVYNTSGQIVSQLTWARSGQLALKKNQLYLLHFSTVHNIWTQKIIIP